MVDVIFWQDNYHKTNFCIKLFDNIFHIEFDINLKEYFINEEAIYEMITNLVYMSDEDLQEDIDKEVIVHVKDFNPHKVLHVDKVKAMYYNNQEITKSLCNVTLQ